MNEIRIIHGAGYVNARMAAKDISGRRDCRIRVHWKDQGYTVVRFCETPQRPEVCIHYMTQVLAPVCSQYDALVVPCGCQDSFELGRAGRISCHVQKGI